MKQIIVLLFILQPLFSFAQHSTPKDSIPQPVYDTISMDIQSTNSFYFCSTLYAIPRNCENKDQSDCCSYDAQISKTKNSDRSGQISCYNGTSLSWIICDTEEMAKQNVESYPGQIKKQMKSFKQTAIALFICDKTVTAQKLTYTTYQGYTINELIFYGTVNGQNLSGHLYLSKNETASSQLTPFFQQLVRF